MKTDSAKDSVEFMTFKHIWQQNIEEINWKHSKCGYGEGGHRKMCNERVMKRISERQMMMVTMENNKGNWFEPWLGIEAYNFCRCGWREKRTRGNISREH